MELSTEIGCRIKEVRGTLSQAAFASTLNVGQSTIGRYEKGERSPDADFILLLRKHYDVNPNWLILGENPKYIQNGVGQNEPETYKADSKPKKENIIVIKHQDLVSKFKNPEKGIENNMHLLNIEQASEHLYNKVSEYLKTTSETAKILKSEMEDYPKKDKNSEQSNSRKADGA